jgi:acetoin utilization deacetylase AcuC-like enzyme
MRDLLSRFHESIRRSLSRFLHSLHGRRVHFVYHGGYEYTIGGIASDPLRAQRTLAYLLDQGLIGERDLSTPIPASLENISRVHTPAYLDRLDHTETMVSVLGFSITDEGWQGLIDVQRLMTGGTIQATRLALRTGCDAVNLGGGFHHANPERGAGFCIINDVAVAIKRLRAKGYQHRILVVDLDIHDGNGTRVAFRNDPTVYTLSIHNETWDDRPAVADSTIALGPDVDDDRYLEVIRRELPPVVANHKPGLVLYVAGVDPAADDQIGNWHISDKGLLTRDRIVFEQVKCDGRRVPLVVVLGGGYGGKAWRYSARFYAWMLAGEEHDPQEDIDAIVRRFRRIENEAAAGTRPRDSAWRLSDEDLLPGLAGAADSRILGQYTKVGFELQLERLGILNQIRAKGFAAPTVTLDTSELGHTIRLFGNTDRAELLMELRLRRDRIAVPGMEMLYVEWLLLQNPRAHFTADRSRLPGQEKPGLGLLREIVALLVLICEQIELDGIMFVPAHYYMAALGHRHLRFVHAADAAAFDAMQEAVNEQGLADATRLIEQGAVVDKATNVPIKWHAPPMVLPVGRRLRQSLQGAGFEEEYSRLRSQVCYELRHLS